MTIPPYNPQVPLSEDTIADGQLAFLTNFKTIFSAFSTNHIPLNDSTNPGNHSVIELIEQNKSRSTESQEVVFYSKKVTDQTDQLFMRYPLNGKEFQISQYQIFPLSIIPGVQARYFTFLPGGIIVYFGFIAPSKDNFPIDLTPALCSNIMGINLCPIGTSTIANPFYQSNPSGFTLQNGKISQLIISNSTTFSPPPFQYYLIFGNI